MFDHLINDWRQEFTALAQVKLIKEAHIIRLLQVYSNGVSSKEFGRHYKACRWIHNSTGADNQEIIGVLEQFFNLVKV